MSETGNEQEVPPENHYKSDRDIKVKPGFLFLNPGHSGEIAKTFKDAIKGSDIFIIQSDPSSKPVRGLNIDINHLSESPTLRDPNAQKVLLLDMKNELRQADVPTLRAEIKKMPSLAAIYETHIHDSTTQLETAESLFRQMKEREIEFAWDIDPNDPGAQEAKEYYDIIQDAIRNAKPVPQESEKTA